jgi:predicted ArsR family transcriptional regulator
MLQEQARALGDPTRHRIFRYLFESARPVDVAELTSYLELNHNAIRQHLAKLVDADLVMEEKAPSSGRGGRPRLLYTINPVAEGRWGPSGPYERLSLLLSEIIRTGAHPVEVGRRAGGRLRLGSSAVLDPMTELVEQMARQGFDPAVKQRGNDVVVTLRTCPFLTTALADPETVCNLHLGIAQGIADSLGGIVIDELVPKDPRRANCRLRCHLAPTEKSRSR